MTAAAHQSAGPTANVVYPKTRRMRFRFGEPEPMQRHFINDDIAFSHLVAVLSAVFPGGEEMFVRSVRRFAGLITTPDLKKRVAGFIGQESVHGQQHRGLNDKLVELGYRVDIAEERFARLEKLEGYLDTKFPEQSQLRLLKLAMLSGTAAAEHFTAVLGERLLTRPDVRALMTDPEVRNLLNWHAFEELEHKSVAFDVYRAVGGPEWLRIATMRGMGAIAVPAFTLGTWVSIALSDPEGRRQPLRVLRETVRLLRGPFIKDLRAAGKPYLRRGFHPDDIETNDTLEYWRDELFGNQGQLLDRLR
ncbi:metal-dependent hydrolase [Mycobacteroides salmoniphilum]|uniref:metal-dependent hydrolase n=1 Tax=Mycobacteroides salmoniphilum TaxID=404941 RepID=UPI00106647D7|nr:metal-dependent hydrolase [Mycobacteroides salmoniphilum]